MGKYSDQMPDFVKALSEVMERNNLAISALSVRLKAVEDELRFRREIDEIGGKDG